MPRKREKWIKSSNEKQEREVMSENFLNGLSMPKSAKT